MIKFETMEGELTCKNGVILDFKFNGTKLEFESMGRVEMSPQFAMDILNSIVELGTVEPKKRRGRPAGSKNKPKTEPDATQETPAATVTASQKPEFSAADLSESFKTTGTQTGRMSTKTPNEANTPKTESAEKTNGDSGSNGSLLLSDTCPPKLVKARKLGDLITPLYNEAIELGIGESLDGEEQLDEISKTIATRLEAWRGQVPLIDKKAPEKLQGAVARALVVIAPAL